MTESSSRHIGTLYRFCALSMHYPEPDWFTEDYLINLYTLLETLGAVEEKEKIAQSTNISPESLEALQVEYTRLFINGFPHVAAPPYGSVYIDKSLQGIHTEKTLRFYTSYGYSLKAGADLPDHIIHQLEFLSLLADSDDSQAEAEFLKTIFAPWFVKFHARVKQESKHPFYSVIVQLIDYLTKEEDEHGIQLDEA